MSDCDFDYAELFITQNTFRNNNLNSSTDVEENASIFCDIFNDDTDIKISEPEFSDIDEQELIQISQEAESDEAKHKMSELPITENNLEATNYDSGRFHFKTDEEAHGFGKKK